MIATFIPIFVVVCIAISANHISQNRWDEYPYSQGQKQERVTANYALSAIAFFRQPPNEPQQQQYDPYSDKLYRVYLWATITGVFSACFLLLYVIKQANDARTIERAWIMVNVQSVGFSSGWPDAPTDFTTIQIRIICTNDGKSPGWIIEKRAGL